MTYLVYCENNCGKTIIRETTSGVCMWCEGIEIPKETQYDVALKEQMEYMDNQNFGWEGKERSMAPFNKRWNA